MIKRKALKNYKWYATLFITNFSKKVTIFVLQENLQKMKYKKVMLISIQTKKSSISETW